MPKKHLRALQIKQKKKRLERLLMSSKQGTKKEYETKVTVNGEEKEVKFMFQHLGVRETIKFMNRTEGKGDLRVDELFDHVIRDENGAKLKLEDFDEYDDGVMKVIELTTAAQSFLAKGTVPETKK